MSSPALDLGKYLHENSFLTVGQDLFVGEWGNCDRHQQALLIDSVGMVPANQESYEAPSIQILIRGGLTQSYIDVYEFAQNVYNLVLGIPTPFELNANCYSGFSVGIPLQPLGKDERNRHVLTMSFQTYRNH